mgnify:CR=1 FL=1
MMADKFLLSQHAERHHCAHGPVGGRRRFPVAPFNHQADGGKLDDFRYSRGDKSGLIERRIEKAQVFGPPNG